MPLEWGQTDPKLSASLMYEDKLLLTIRIERLKGNRTFSQKPKSRCHHLLQTPQIDRRDEAKNEYVTWTPMHYVETRFDDQQLYAAWATHTLTDVRGQAADQAQARRPRQQRRPRSAASSSSCDCQDGSGGEAQIFRAQIFERQSYDGVVACLPVTIPYRRYSTNSAQWWLGRALHELTKRANLRPDRHRRARGVELHGGARHRDRADPAFRRIAALARSHSLRRRERHRRAAPRGACGAGRRRRHRRLRRRRHQPCRTRSGRRCRLSRASRRTRSIPTAPAAPTRRLR